MCAVCGNICCSPSRAFANIYTCFAFALGAIFEDSSGDLGAVLPLSRRVASDMVLGAVLAPLAVISGIWFS